MADPITLAVVGAGVGAMMNPNDPIEGAIIGGAAGFTGGTALGAGAASAAAGTTVGAGGIGGAAGGTGLTATTIGGAAPASAGLGVASGGTGFTASAFPSAAGMGGGTGLLGTAGTGAMASAPFATAAGAPTMMATNPLSNLFGGKTSDQLSIAQKLAERGAQRGPNAPNIQSRPATGMRLPVNQPLNYNAPVLALLEQSRMREERPMFSLL